MREGGDNKNNSMRYILQDLNKTVKHDIDQFKPKAGSPPRPAHQLSGVLQKYHKHTLDEGLLVDRQAQDGRLQTCNTALTCEVTLNSLLLNTPYCRAAAVFSFISCSTERSASSAALCGEGRRGGGEGRHGDSGREK